MENRISKHFVQDVSHKGTVRRKAKKDGGEPEDVGEMLVASVDFGPNIAIYLKEINSALIVGEK
jgi:hypothetical protein